MVGQILKDVVPILIQGLVEAFDIFKEVGDTSLQLLGGVLTQLGLDDVNGFIIMLHSEHQLLHWCYFCLIGFQFEGLYGVNDLNNTLRRLNMEFMVQSK